MLQIKSRPQKCIGYDIFVKQHNPYTSQASFAKGIDPINSHTSYFGKSIGPNKRTVPINRTVSSKWNQIVLHFKILGSSGSYEGKVILLGKALNQA